MTAEELKAHAEHLPRPETMVDAVRVFEDQDTCLGYMIALRWPDGVVCPRCQSRRVRFIATRRLWECREGHPCARFSVKTGTVMEDSPLKLDKWLIGIWLEANAKNSISSYEVHRALKITQKTAWFMQQRIRLAMQSGGFFQPMGDPAGVEVDETYIGGKARNMHPAKRAAKIKARGAGGKAAVMGLLDRHTREVRTVFIPNTKRKTLHPIIREHVQPGSTVFSDSHPAYVGLSPDFIHKVVDHAETYVKGNVYTNGLENFWALFKRGIKGTHISVEPFHLFRYFDAECFRFNNRKTNDGTRFVRVLAGLEGRRLTYKNLIGENQPAPVV